MDSCSRGSLRTSRARWPTRGTCASLPAGHAVPTPGGNVPDRTSRTFARLPGRATFPVDAQGHLGQSPARAHGPEDGHRRASAQLRAALPGDGGPADPNLMLQEYVPGGDDDVLLMFNGYFDGDVRTACSLQHGARAAPGRPSTPRATTPRRLPAQTTWWIEPARRWMKELGYRGILDIGYGCRRARQGESPRCSTWTRGSAARSSLFVGARRHGRGAGALYLDLTGRPVPEAAEPRRGPQVGWTSSDVGCVPPVPARSPAHPAPSGPASLQGVRETVILRSAPGPAPFWRAWSHALRRSPAASGAQGAGCQRQPAGCPRGARSVRRGRACRHQVAGRPALRFERRRGWKTIYEERTVFGLVLPGAPGESRWTRMAGLGPAGRRARARGSGVGAGLTSAALARSAGLLVPPRWTAAPTMIELADRLAQ